MTHGGRSEEHDELQIRSLQQQLTTAEKISLIAGQGFETTAIPRLGIAAMYMTDGPAGVRSGQATAFPSAVALASSWNPDLMRRVGAAMAREAKAQGCQALLAPCINLHRFPIGGRNFESFGEDPFLAGKLAAAMIQGIQQEGVAAALKHFACNNQEWLRSEIDVHVSERALRELYLKGFEIAVREGRPWMVMSAYNRVNGQWASENPHLLRRILKGEWGFTGLVISDWEATHEMVLAANGGLDLEMPRAKHFHPDRVQSALDDGRIGHEILDEQVTRILRVLARTGRLDPRSHQASSTINMAHPQLAHEAATSGIVLLKNEASLLPLSPQKPIQMAIIGPNAKKARIGGGGSSKVKPHHTVSPWQGLIEMEEGCIDCSFSLGCPIEGDLVVIEDSALSHVHEGLRKQGLRAEYFANTELHGEPARVTTDAEVDFFWCFDHPDPEQKVGEDLHNFSVRWQGILEAPLSGVYTLEVRHSDGVRLTIDDQLIIDNWTPTAFNQTVWDSALVELQAGEHALELTYFCAKNLADIQLGWQIPGRDLLAEAISLAARSDVALVCIGLSDRYESENRDRVSLRLKRQEELVTAVAKANARTIVAVISGSPIDMSQWIDNVPTVLMAWYGGQEGGRALAEVILGQINPSAKLPCTFYRKLTDSPGMDGYPQSQPMVEYEEGLFIGYRHCDRSGIAPLFPFGHGLSFTRFHLRDLEVTVAGDGICRVSCTLHNIGHRAGAEVVQVYAGPLHAGSESPSKCLRGFQRLELGPAASAQVEICFPISDFSRYDEDVSDWKLDVGPYRLWVGHSAQDLPLSADILIDAQGKGVIR